MRIKMLHVKAATIGLVVLSSIQMIGCSSRTSDKVKSTSDSDRASAASTQHDMSGMMASSPDAATQPYDLQFLDTMTAHHQSAIDMAQMVGSKAAHPELTEFAKDIVRDQQAEIARMHQWREQWYPNRPLAKNMEMPGMMESMKGMDTGHMQKMSGSEFDHMFLDMMIPHHEGAVTMATEALTRAEHEEIRQMARQIIDKQKSEIEKMARWKSEWAGH